MINATVPVLEEALRARGGQFESVFYDGAPHAFFNDTRPSYPVEAARDAFVRALGFLKAQLA